MGSMSGGSGGQQDWSAAETSAEVSRDIWETYKQDYTDWENQLINAASDTSADRLESDQYAVADTENAFAQAKNAFSMENERMGVNITPDQKRAMDRSDGLAMAAAKASNINRGRDKVEDRAMQLMAGGVSAKNSV